MTCTGSALPYVCAAVALLVFLVGILAWALASTRDELHRVQSENRTYRRDIVHGVTEMGWLWPTRAPGPDERS